MASFVREIRASILPVPIYLNRHPGSAYCGRKDRISDDRHAAGGQTEVREDHLHRVDAPGQAHQERHSGRDEVADAPRLKHLWLF